MIKNIIFDLAGVIINLNLERDTAALNSVGLPDFAGCIANPDIAAPMLAYLNGLSSAKEFLHDIRPFCNAEATDADILWSMDAVLDDIPASRLQKLVDLRKQYRVFLLSNLYEVAWTLTLKEFERNGFTPSQCFDKVFLSYEMHLAKPDPEIYKRVVAETGINPDETAYYDDSRDNIESARALGFHSILVPMNCLESVLEQ